MRNILAVVSDVVVLIVALLLGFVVAKNYFFPSKVAQSLIKPGDMLPPIEGVDLSSHDQSLLLALKVGCHFCEEDIPFYRRLLQLTESRELELNLVALFPDDGVAVRAFLQREKIPLKVVANAALRELKVTGTPTLILVDRTGRVIQVWTGALPPSEEEELIRRLKASRVSVRGILPQGEFNSIGGAR